MVDVKRDNLRLIPHEDFRLLEAAGNDRDKLVIATLMSRPGAMQFSMELEETHFAPGTGRNPLFEMALLKWPEPHIVWAVIIVPIEAKPWAQGIAKKHGLRLADGVPHFVEWERNVPLLAAVRQLPPELTAKPHKVFPAKGANVFTLEHDHGKPGPHVAGVVT
jgi:hypothetical protein